MRIAAAERAERDLARAPFLAIDAVDVQISRLATRGETQLAEVLSWLQSSGLAARPDQVFGAYRVPDRISQTLTPHTERGRVVEWDIVHAPVEQMPGPALVATSFVAADHWVARRLGQPSVLDEDLPLAFCLGAGIDPSRCLGIARMSEFRAIQGVSSDDGGGDIYTLVRGVVAIHPEESSHQFAAMRAAAPLELPDAAAGVHVELLNWSAIARAVHLKVHHPPPAPSPFPYLPATPQELLRSYLSIVGVQPSDCYSAQATVDHPSPMIQGGFFTTNIGPKQPCADGKDRMRTHGCELVLIAYRDTPAYAAGRERWAGYCSEVLQANLGNGLRMRPAIAVPDDIAGWPAPLRAAVRVADAIDWLDEVGVERIPPYRYCWPPVS
jgi:hypothetical protein